MKKKNHLFNLLLPVVLLIVSCSGCSKKEQFHSYMRGKVNGESFKEFGVPRASRAGSATSLAGGDSSLEITTLLNIGRFDLALVIYKEPGSIVTGVYEFRNNSMRSGSMEIFSSTTNLLPGYYLSGNRRLDTLQLLGSGKIVISEISTDYVKGSFDFVTAPGSNGEPALHVTDGEFHIKRQ
jgi:hypothetical protein